MAFIKFDSENNAQNALPMMNGQVLLMFIFLCPATMLLEGRNVMHHVKPVTMRCYAVMLLSLLSLLSLTLQAIDGSEGIRADFAKSSLGKSRR